MVIGLRKCPSPVLACILISPPLVLRGGSPSFFFNFPPNGGGGGRYLPRGNDPPLYEGKISGHSKGD